MPYQGLDILAVNGDAALEDFVRQAMHEDHSWSLTTGRAANNAELVEQVRGHMPDVLLLDARDGGAQPEALAEALPAVPLVIVAAGPAVSASGYFRGLHHIIDASHLQPPLLRYILYNAVERGRQARLRQSVLASEAEARNHLAHLQVIYATAPVGLAFTGLDHRYVSLNERLAEFNGFSVAEMLGQRADELLPEPAGAQAIAFRQQVLETGQPVLNVELRAITPDEAGVARTWLCNYYPVYDAGGELFGVSAAIIEITERKQLEERLEEQVQERTAQARRLATDLTLAEQRERRRIARVLHDDIQQKLYALQVHLHLIALHEGPESGEPAGLIGQLIDELIEDSSRLGVELSPPTLSQAGLADAVGWLRDYMTRQHGLEVRLETAGDLTVDDPDLREVICQMVRELLVNVARHAGVGEAALRIRREGQRLVILVADDGVGFDPEFVLASPRVQTSLGLRTLAERADIFGGDLKIDSQPGGGTRITLAVPLEVSAQ